jgi:transcription elongation factor GreA
MTEKILLTEKKINSLKKELEKLQGKKKIELSESLERARLNDVSEETGDVLAVMGELEKVDERIDEIKNILKNVKVLDKNGCNINEVGVGTEVKVKVGGKTKKLQIVSEVEADPTKNKISDKSPLGQALKKAKKGDKIRLDVHDREVVIYEVVDIC